MPGVSGEMSLAGRFYLSAMWASNRLRFSENPTLAMHSLPASGFSDVRDHSSQHKDATDGVVLRCVFNDDRYPWDFRSFAPAAAGATTI